MVTVRKKLKKGILTGSEEATKIKGSERLEIKNS